MKDDIPWRPWSEVLHEMQLFKTAAADRFMEVVFEETQKTLRPEIALLNTLMRKSSDAAARGEALAQAAAAGTLDRDGGYFFSLLERVRRDVGAQRGNPQREETLELLAGVRDQAEKARRGGRTQPTTP